MVIRRRPPGDVSATIGEVAARGRQGAKRVDGKDPSHGPRRPVRVPSAETERSARCGAGGEADVTYGVGGSPGKIWPWIFQGSYPVHSSK